MTTPAPSPKQKKPPVDWPAIEPHYRAGVRSLKELGLQYGVSDAAIIKHAKKMEWTRDLSAKIKARADAKVSASVVSATVSAANQMRENTVVEAVANQQAGIRLAHQHKIKRTLGVFEAMLGELEMTSNPEGQGLIEALMDLCRKPESESDEEATRRKKRQADQLEKILALPSRVDTGKKLAEMLERLVNMERVAHGIKAEETAPGGELADFVRALGAKGSALPVSHVLEPEDA